MLYQSWPDTLIPCSGHRKYRRYQSGQIRTVYWYQNPVLSPERGEQTERPISGRSWMHLPSLVFGRSLLWHPHRLVSQRLS